MTGRRQLPPVEDLREMRDAGMSLREIADRVFDLTGETVTKSGISAALVRAGAGKDLVRYEDLIPWRVQMQHQKQYHLRMLRLEGRRRAGHPLEPGQERRLQSWLDDLKLENAVIHYNPLREPGFHPVTRRDGIDTDLIRWTPEQLVEQGYTRDQVDSLPVSERLRVKPEEWNGYARVA